MTLDEELRTYADHVELPAVLCAAIRRAAARIGQLEAELSRVEAYLGAFCDQGLPDDHPAAALWSSVQAALAAEEARRW